MRTEEQRRLPFRYIRLEGAYLMTPLEYFEASSEGEAWHLHMPTEIHGAFGGVTGGALAAAAIAVARTVKPNRIAAGVDIRFLRG